MDFKINKDNWKKVTLGDVVFEPKETAKNIIEEGFEHIVGLEHIDSNDIHLKKSFSIETNTTFTKVFRRDDVLFGRRRAYLKKAAQAAFDGVCSGDITVLRANGKLDRRLLPFVIHNEKFFDYAVKHSAGGLSPRVKFKDLANYEFLLPPKAQQAELADLLWAIDDVIEKDLEVLKRLEKDIQNIFLSKIIDFNIEGLTITNILDNLSKKVGLGLLKDFGIFLKGKGIPKDDVIESGIPCIRYGEIYTSHHIVIRKFRSFINEEVASTSFQLNKGDIVFVGSGETITEIGKSVCFTDDFEAYAGGDTIIYRPDLNKIYPVYLSYLLNSLLIRLQLNKMGTGATVAHIYPEDLKKIKIPLLDISLQKEIAIEMETIFQGIDKLKSKLQSSKALQKSLINQIF
ncbi:restriction endonuclease subunit S [Myroides odoratimimus]|uniref:restriction endonuclease subunit S n=1 Tax=Myroides odoratimimus TaxID=76832 RepID=UPI002576C448|nr:restriction endonuclease subunit S [Myroides odoratimimus]MDM1402194.1 restriction endonuclease subunit S [Myroides odoratimimus]MEC4036572.1 restriction endonuclease subunit S [Myroides odoratimimus]